MADIHSKPVPGTSQWSDKPSPPTPWNYQMVMACAPISRATVSTSLTQISATANSVTYQHPLNPNVASDLSRSYQWSTDLVEWKASGQTNTGNTIATITAPPPVAGVVTVTINAGPAAKLFGRLVAT